MFPNVKKVYGITWCLLPAFKYFLNLTFWTQDLYVCAQSLSHVRLFATPWTVAHQAPRSMAFSRQEYWSGLPFPPPGESSRPRDWTRVSCIGRWFFTTPPPGKPQDLYGVLKNIHSYLLLQVEKLRSGKGLSCSGSSSSLLILGLEPKWWLLVLHLNCLLAPHLHAGELEQHNR